MHRWDWVPRQVKRAAAIALVLSVVGTVAYQVAGNPAPHRRPPVRLAATREPTTLSIRTEPATVAYGRVATVTGLLTGRYGTPVAGQVVRLLSRRHGASDEPGLLTTAVSGDDGVVRFALTGLGSVDLSWEFGGSAVHVAAASRLVPVLVASKVTLHAVTSPAVPGGWRTTLRGAVAPARRGGPVVLLRWRLGRWVRETTSRLNVRGAFTLAAREPAPGTYRYRVVVPADEDRVAGTAAQVVRLNGGQRPQPARPAGGPKTRLLVTGDSLASYLGMQLTHDGGRLGRLDATTDSRISTGLARPDYFDWVAHARAQMAALHPDAVVMFVGGNDCQNMRRGGTGSWATVGTPDWTAEYARRAAEVMRIYADGGRRRVYWVDMPIAKKPETAACFHDIGQATRAAAAGLPGVTWVDIWSLYAVGGHYSDRVQGVVAREPDGIHLTYAGTRLLTRRVLGLLNAAYHLTG